MIALRFKIDEDLPSEIATLFRRAGHDAASIVEQGMTGASDPLVWDHVQVEARCLVTADKGFGDLQRRRSERHRGLVLLRLPRESRSGYMRLAERLLTQADLETIAGAVTVVTPDSIRVHRHP